ncbi:hypothetical protein ACIGFK_18130 [Streptomyces sp. NPDC085524]|uniref:hypothetical protein n=1 Tax=Streptomyces sp. NPDC085524 TaxID=3365728 RepID=UPI0037D5B252
MQRETTMRAVRGPRTTPGRAALAALAVSATLALTACGPAAGKAGPAASPSAAGPAGSLAPATPSATAKTPAPSASKSAAKPAATKKPGSPVPSASCDHKMPIAPDLIAVYRYTPEGGSHNLIVRYGNWSCGTPGDGAYFDAVGKEVFVPIADTAKITATAPIVQGSAPEKITLQQLIDWVTAHPDAGRPFQYHLGADGAIDTLDEVYLP